MIFVKFNVNAGEQDVDHSECPFCGEMYTVEWTYHSGSYWTPPEWEDHEVNPGCKHLVNVTEEEHWYFRWPGLYNWAVGQWYRRVTSRRWYQRLKRRIRRARMARRRQG